MAVRTATRPAARFANNQVCARCLIRWTFSSRQPLYRPSTLLTRQVHSDLVPDRAIQRNMPVNPQSFSQNYFSANTAIDRGWVNNGLLAAFQTSINLPHRPTRGPAIANVENPSATDERSSASEETQNGEDEAQSMTKPSLADVSAPVQTATAAVADLEPSAAPAPAAVSRHRLRRRQQLEQLQQLQQLQQLPEHQQHQQQQTHDPAAGIPIIPPDASSQLTTAATSMPKTASFRRSVATYLSLTKPRLSSGVVLTAAAAYGLYPIPEIISSASVLEPTTLSSSTLTLLFLSAGTFLSSAAANTLNMMMEPAYDAQMSRTRNRPLVRKLVTPTRAGVFAVACGTAGLMLLDLGTNSTVAALSALNIFLYAGVYTPMKRMSVVNTWVGALVGAIPPLMGWAAAAGHAATTEHHTAADLLWTWPDAAGGWLLAALLFAWQFPHFNGLAHGIRDEYRRAGYRMLAWTNPARSARVALRYSLAMFPICAGLWAVGLVNDGFIVLSTVANGWIGLRAYQFWRRAGAGASARNLFWASVWYLPLVMVGALVCKSGIWEGMLPSDIVEAEGLGLGLGMGPSGVTVPPGPGSVVHDDVGGTVAAGAAALRQRARQGAT